MEHARTFYDHHYKDVWMGFAKLLLVIEYIQM